MYTVSHRAIKGARRNSVGPHRTALTTAEPQRTNETVALPTSVSPQRGAGDDTANLAEVLFGKDADAKLLLHKDDSRRNSTSKRPILAIAEPSENEIFSPKEFVASLRQIIAQDEVRRQRLGDNKKRQAKLRVELEELEEEAILLKTALRQSKTERKRLRSSVSERELEFLKAGQDLVQDSAKRMRFTEDSGSEDGDEQ